MVDLAQRWFAFDGNPAVAIRKKMSLFEEQGPYGSIFMMARSAEEYLVAYLLFEQLQERLRTHITKAKEELKATQGTGRMPFRTRNYLMVGRATKLAAAHMTALLGRALRERYGGFNQYVARRLLSSLNTGEFVETVYSDLEDTLFRFSGQVLQHDKTLHRILSETDTFEELYELFSYVSERELTKGRDIFALIE